MSRRRTSNQLLFNFAGSILLLVLVLLTQAARAQAPALAWSTNLGARVFDVDNQTNVYARVGNQVFVLNSAGVPLQTNTICPLPGVVRRDNTGNYYVGGSFDGTQNFGGITLVGGWTNNIGHYTPGWPTCFLTKYASNGSLQWATSFGSQAHRNLLMDMVLDPGGGFYAAYSCSGDYAKVAHVGNTGALDWTWNISGTLFLEALGSQFGGMTSSNCCLLTVRNVPGGSALLNRLDRSGNAVMLGPYGLSARTWAATNGVPVTDDLGNPYQIGQCFDPAQNPPCTAEWIRKCAPGTDLWVKEVTPDVEYVLARDPAGNIYAGGSSNVLARYSDSGDLVWGSNYAASAVSMVADASANRFVSFADGSVARLGEEGASSSRFSIGTVPSGGLNFTLISAPGNIWMIQSSSNLSTWSCFAIITNSSGGIQFSDPTAGQVRARFYRAVALP